MPPFLEQISQLPGQFIGPQTPTTIGAPTVPRRPGGYETPETESLQDSYNPVEDLPPTGLARKGLSSLGGLVAGQLFTHPQWRGATEKALSDISSLFADYILRTPSKFYVGPMPLGKTLAQPYLKGQFFSPQNTGRLLRPEARAVSQVPLRPTVGVAEINPMTSKNSLEFASRDPLDIHETIKHEVFGHGLATATGNEGREIPGIGIRNDIQNYLHRNYPISQHDEEIAAMHLGNQQSVYPGEKFASPDTAITNVGLYKPWLERNFTPGGSTLKTPSVFENLAFPEGTTTEEIINKLQGMQSDKPRLFR